MRKASEGMRKAETLQMFLVYNRGRISISTVGGRMSRKRRKNIDPFVRDTGREREADVYIHPKEGANVFVVSPRTECIVGVRDICLKENVYMCISILS